MDGPVVINSHLHIPLAELRFQFSRSGGKGGQNVNKVETKVELLFDVFHSPTLSENERQRIHRYFSSRLDSDGFLHIVSQESRSQWTNREEAVAKFIVMMQEALRPVKKRVKTRISKGAKQRRLDQKKRRGDIKKMRRGGVE